MLKQYTGYTCNIEWFLPNTTHCRLSHNIDNIMPINIPIERDVFNLFGRVLTVMTLFYKAYLSPLWYFIFKYAICPYDWSKPSQCILKYIHYHMETIYSILSRGRYDSWTVSKEMNELNILTSTEMSQLIQYVCTI